MRVTAALACLLLAGCSARAPVREPAPAEATSGGGAAMTAEPQIVVDAYGEMVALSEDVERLASGLECGGACEAGHRLCALSDRICEVAERNEGDLEIEQRCADGRARCARARARLAEACGCSGLE